eukprot:124156_1
MMSSRKRQLEDKDSSPPPNKKTKLNLLNKHSVDKITDEFEDYSDEVWNHPSLLQYIANANSNSQNNKVTTTTNTKHELHDADVNNAMQAKIKNANISEYDYYDGCGPCVNMAGHDPKSKTNPPPFKKRRIRDIYIQTKKKRN